MPIYDFKCGKCNQVTERIQKHNDPPPICKVCRAVLTRMPAAGSFKIEGAGVYKPGFSRRKGDT